MYLTIAGNIGSGKTTLTKMLARYYRCAAVHDDINSNPYIVSFYEDMQRWSFNLQISFLTKRFKQLIEISKKENATICDRSIYEDAAIFAPNLKDMGLLTLRDHDVYQELFSMLVEVIPYPDLMIYIKANTSTLVSQIQKRGRKYENTIRIDYLQNLNEKYDQWARRYQHPILIINSDTCKFEENNYHFQSVIDEIAIHLPKLKKPNKK